MGFSCIAIEHHIIPPEQYHEAKALAQRLEDYGGTVFERRKKEQRVQEIRLKIMNNQMLPFYWVVAQIRETGERARFNGQHSSDTMLNYMVDEDWSYVKTNIPIIWIEYACDALYDAAELFAQFDRHMSVRDPTDIIGVDINIHEDLRVEAGNARWLDAPLMAKITRGMQWFHEKALLEPKHADRYRQLVHEPDQRIHAFFHYCRSFLNIEKTSEMLTDPVIAALYHTTRNGHDLLQDFWRSVSLGEQHLDEGTIPYKLAGFLADYKRKKTTVWRTAIKNRLSGKHPYPNESDCFATCLHACHAYQHGQKMGEVFEGANGRKPVALLQLYPFDTSLPAAAD